MMEADQQLQTHSEIFLKVFTKANIFKAGENALVRGYGGKALEYFDFLRFHKFSLNNSNYNCLPIRFTFDLVTVLSINVTCFIRKRLEMS